MKTPEEILYNLVCDKVNYENWIKLIPLVVYQAMEEYGKQQYNQAIKDAVENATIRPKLNNFGYTVNENSILKLLKL